MDTLFLKVRNIGTETFDDFGATGETIKQINDVFLCTEHGRRLRYYDTKTLEPADDVLADKWSGMIENKEMEVGASRLRVRFITLADGSKAGVKGQRYFIQRPDENEPKFQPIPVMAPPTRIHTVIPSRTGCCGAQADSARRYSAMIPGMAPFGTPMRYAMPAVKCTVWRLWAMN